MQGHPLSGRGLVGILALTPLLLVLVTRWLDQPVARWVERILERRYGSQAALPVYPDLLLPLVCLLTPLAWAVYYRARTGRHGGAFARACHLVGVSLPLAFLFKSALKFLFGRTATRQWLVAQPETTFHWLRGHFPNDGFPSGHMMVVTVLVLGWRSQFPASRAASDLALVLLGAALVMTNYHFLGDVVAGWYFGFIVHRSSRALPSMQR
jgi:membrane-associated phospholipid phosphatase